MVGEWLPAPAGQLQLTGWVCPFSEQIEHSFLFIFLQHGSFAREQMSSIIPVNGCLPN